MPKRTCAFCAKRSGLAMRVCMLVNLMAGICLIAFACSVQYPIQTLSAVGMLLLGILSVLSTVAGLVGSWHYRICLTAFLWLGGVSTFFQMVLVIAMHVNFEGVLNDLDTHTDGKYARENVSVVLEQAKWAFLVFLLIEIVTIILAVLLKWYIPDDPLGDYDNFDEAVASERMISMQSLRSDIENRGGSSPGSTSKTYDKLRGKMAGKYGQFSHGVEWKKKSWFSRG